MHAYTWEYKKLFADILQKIFCPDTLQYPIFADLLQRLQQVAKMQLAAS